MSWFSRMFKPQPVTTRRTLPGAAVALLLRQALERSLAPNYRHVSTKARMAVTSREMIRAASDRSYLPWLKDRWECEDQARALVHELQLLARDEGCSHACGVLIGLHADDPVPDDRQDFHVWVWALVESADDRTRLVLFDATAREWADIPDVSDIHFSCT